MPFIPVLTLDAVEGAECGTVNGKFYAVRTGWIKNIDTTLPREQILAQALDVPGMPARFDDFPSPDPLKALAKLTRHRFVTIPGVNYKILVTLVYEIPEFGGNPAAGSFVLERRTHLASEEVLFLPDGTPLDVNWTNQNDPLAKTIVDAAPCVVEKPRQILIATGFYEGMPPDVMTTGIGKVNSTDWHGFPVGYWRYEGETDRTADFGASYAIQLQFTTKVVEDWASFARMRDASTGKYLNVSASEVADVKGQAYHKGVYTLSGGRSRTVRGGTTGKPNGFIAFGFYDLLDFNASFGF